VGRLSLRCGPALAALLWSCAGVWSCAGLFGCAHREPASTASGTLCGEGLEPLGEACLALPPGAPSDVPVVLYLHGMFPSDYPQQSLIAQRELATMATARGFALLVPRGRLGLCDWKPELLNWYCWPSTMRTAQLAPEIVQGWTPLWKALDDRLGGSADRPRKRFVLGYSNGGFFAALLAARGDLPFDAYAIAHGGAVEPCWFDPSRPAPMLLLSAEGDQWQAPLMAELHERLDEASWPNEHRIRQGGHALTAGDIEDALGFFASHRQQ
jgi:predicted esterase